MTVDPKASYTTTLLPKCTHPTHIAPFSVKWDADIYGAEGAS